MNLLFPISILILHFTEITLYKLNESNEKGSVIALPSSEVEVKIYKDGQITEDTSVKGETTTTGKLKISLKDATSANDVDEGKRKISVSYTGNDGKVSYSGILYIQDINAIIEPSIISREEVGTGKEITIIYGEYFLH